MFTMQGFGEKGAYIFTRVHIHTKCSELSTYTRTHTHLHIHARTHTHTHTHAHTHTHTHTQNHKDLSTHICRHACKNQKELHTITRICTHIRVTMS